MISETGHPFVDDKVPHTKANRTWAGVDELLQERQHGNVRVRREGAQETVRRHAAGQFVVVPEQPAQDLKGVRICSAVEAVTLGQAQQDRRGQPRPFFRRVSVDLPIRFLVLTRYPMSWMMMRAKSHR